MKYKASLRGVSLVMTLGVIVLLTTIVIETYITSKETPIWLFESGFFALILVFCYSFAPQSYTLNENELTINRPVGKIKVELKEIMLVERIINFEGYTIRNLGSGGLFGSYGKFFNSRIGNMNMYVTRSDTKILIRLKDARNIVISPDDLALLDALNDRVKTSNKKV